MDNGVAAHQMGDTKRTPEAPRPPAQPVALHPIQRGCERKGMNNPGLARVRVQDYGVYFGEDPKEFFKLFCRDFHLGGKFIIRRTPSV